MMPAELHQKPAARINGTVQIKARYAAAAALGNLAVNAYKYYRQMVLIYQARRHNADNACVPAFLCQHNRRINMFILRQHFFGIHKNLTAYFLPQRVFFVQRFGNFRRARFILRR